MNRLLLSAAAAMCFGALASAQDGLVVGVDDAAVGMFVYESGAFTPLADSAVQVWGLASDDANETLYIAANANTLYKWTEAGGLQSIGVFTYNAANVNFVSLAFSNGKLYGTRNITTEGVYEIDPATAVATLLWAYPTAFDFGGIDFDPATGKLYGTNDATSGGTGSGVYEIDFVNQVATKVADYPPIVGSGPNDIDGLAVGNGKAYLVIDQPGEIGVLDLATATYDPPIPAPWTTSEIFSGGAFAPWLVAQACYADCDGNGSLNVFDYICFGNAYSSQQAYADCDGNGQFNVFDYICYGNAYSAGCP